MEARFHDGGTALARLEVPFRARFDAIPFPPRGTGSTPGWGGIPLHTAARRWYERCQQMRPNGETNLNNPERETA